MAACPGVEIGLEGISCDTRRCTISPLKELRTGIGEAILGCFTPFPSICDVTSVALGRKAAAGGPTVDGKFA